jgi:purine-nucleoside/S-methyl-5'-thioadenosine phosphorylase / adenosine deaminase
MKPQPSDGFEWVQATGGPALVCRALRPLADHLFTTRQWTLGSPAEATDEDWRPVAAAAGVDRDHLVRMHQVHGASVLVRRAGHRQPPGPRPAADIAVSNDPSLALAIQTADCVPLLIADRVTGAVAAAHAGWRGLAAGVPGHTIAALAREFGSRPADLIVAAGPSIGACCYEVGADVREAFRRGGFADAVADRWFFSVPQPTASNPSMPGLRAVARPDHWFFDGWAAAQFQLEAAGVPARQIHAAGLCTASHAEVLCSYRRDGKSAGRLAAAIRM